MRAICLAHDQRDPPVRPAISRNPCSRAINASIGFRALWMNSAMPARAIGLQEVAKLRWLPEATFHLFYFSAPRSQESVRSPPDSHAAQEYVRAGGMLPERAKVRETTKPGPPRIRVLAFLLYLTLG